MFNGFIYRQDFFSVVISKILSYNSSSNYAGESKLKYAKLYNKNESSIYRSRAFTLAEVLITLGIIGVIAVMTIKVLTSTADDIRYKTGYRKFYSTFSTAYESVISENGGSFGCTYFSAGGQDWSECQSLFDAIASKIKYSKKCDKNLGTTIGNCIPSPGILYPDGSDVPAGCTKFQFAQQPTNLAYVLEDGTYFFLYSGGGTSSIAPIVAFDVNGFRGPNQWNVDVFDIGFLDYKWTYWSACTTASTKYKDYLMK